MTGHRAGFASAAALAALAALAPGDAFAAPTRAAKDWEAALENGDRQGCLNMLWRAVVDDGRDAEGAIDFYRTHAEALLPDIMIDGCGAAQHRTDQGASAGDGEWEDGEKVSYGLPRGWRGECFTVDVSLRPTAPTYARDLCRTNVSARIYPFAADRPVAVSAPPMPPIPEDRLRRRWQGWNSGMESLIRELALAEKDSAEIRAIAAKVYSETERLHPEIEILTEERDFRVRPKGSEGRIPWLVRKGAPGKIGRQNDIPFGGSKDAKFELQLKCEDPNCAKCSEWKPYEVKDVSWAAAIASNGVFQAIVPDKDLPRFFPEPRARLPEKYLAGDPVAIKIRYAQTGESETVDVEKAKAEKAIEIRPHVRGKTTVLFSYGRYGDAECAIGRPLHRGEVFGKDEKDWGTLPDLVEKEVETEIVFMLDPAAADGADTELEIRRQGGDRAEVSRYTLYFESKTPVSIAEKRYEGRIEYRVHEGEREEDWGEWKYAEFRNGAENKVPVRPAPVAVPVPDDVFDLTRKVVNERRRVKMANTAMVAQDASKSKEWLASGWKDDRKYDPTAKRLMAHFKSPGDCRDEGCRKFRGELRVKTGKPPAECGDNEVFGVFVEWIWENRGKQCHGKIPE